MNNIIKGLSESKRAEIMDIFGGAVQEVYVAGFEEGYAIGQAASSTVEDQAVETIKLTSVDELQKGDKVKFVGPITEYNEYVTVGNVYEIREVDSDGHPSFLDDEQNINRQSFINLKYLHLFEKVVESETFEHEGKLLRKVDREAEEGDYARFSKRQADLSTDVTAGKLYKVYFYKGRLAFECDAHVKIPYYLYGGFERSVETIEVFEVANYIDEIPLEDNPVILTANQQRAELIQRAREFVELHEVDLLGIKQRDYGNQTCRKLYYKTEFFIKGNKVTAVIHRVNRSGKLLKAHMHIGRAICSIGDVFNEWIGKAIALARALQIDIPKEFMRAVQPTIAEIGMVIERLNNHGEVYRDSVTSDTTYLHSLKRSRNHPEQVVILDDTNAIYSEVDSK